MKNIGSRPSRPLKKTSARRGYAIMLVLVFIVLFLSLWSVAYRHTATALRIESGRTLAVQRDEGSLHALARGLALLETGYPPTDPYACGVTIDTSSGPRSLTVTFESAGAETWSVSSRPTRSNENPLPLPGSFAPAVP